jgi:hypothetical protein
MRGLDRRLQLERRYGAGHGTFIGVVGTSGAPDVRLAWEERDIGGAMGPVSSRAAGLLRTAARPY